MKLVFLGAPGAGKGTQAARVSEATKVPHISTGDMFRSALQNQTPTGIKAKAYMDKGELVPDSVTVEMVDERLKQQDCETGYLLDGFPRTLFQAEALDALQPPDLVINLVLPEEELLRRLTQRRVCEKCKGTFSVSMLKNHEICPTCGAPLVHRLDDQPETIKERIVIYNRDTAPLIDYYQAQGKLRSVSGMIGLENVTREILAIIGALA